MKITIPQMQTLAALIGSSTFVEAGNKIGKSDVAIGRQVKLIEDAVGKAIVYRSTTRQLSLTSFGAQLAARYSKILSEVDAANQWATNKDETVTGVVEVAYHDEAMFSATILPLVGEFCDAYPGVDVRFHQIKPVAKHGVFIADVYWGAGDYFGKMNPGLVKTELTRFNFGIYASPAYLLKYGEPKTIEELAGHHLVTSLNRMPHDSLFYYSEQGKEDLSGIKLRNRVQTSNCYLKLATDGLGIVNTVDTLLATAEAVQSGELVPILKKHWIKNMTVSAYFDRQLVANHPVRQFIDFFIEHKDSWLMTRNRA